MKKRKRLFASGLAFLLAIAMCLELTGGIRVWAAEVVSAVTKTQDNTEGNSVILENDTVSLQLVNDYSALELKDKRTGKVWTSSMDDPDFDMDSVSARWQQKMSSLFSVSVTNLATGSGAITSMELLACTYTAEEYETEDGFGVTYDLTDVGICISIEFSLVEDGVSVRIPYEKIEEYGSTFSLVQVDMMSFFGAAADGTQGYLFYPDGSGAIMEFDDPAHYAESSVTYSIYGNITNNENLLSRFDEEQPTVMIPVFGGNYGNEGFVAYVTEGAGSANITVVPATSVVSANYVYATFVYRRNFQDSRVTERTVQVYDADLIPTDYEICYRILEEGSATYVDMAQAYQEYLVESGGMSALTDSGEYKLVLDLFMGIEEEGILFNSFVAMTTFDQAQEILEDLSAGISGDISVSLIGWTKGGYGSEPDFFPANSKLGGNSGLKSLAEYTSENGIDLLLSANFLTVASDASGYSTNTDIVYLANYEVLTDRRESIYIVSPNAAAEFLSKFMKKATNYSIDGVNFENLGSMLYYNYRARSTVTVEECREYWCEMMSSVQESLGKVTVSGGNDYVLAYANVVTDIPLADSGYQMTTASVPFYQILVHGYVEYTGEALNLSSDPDKTQLKWIEYGYLPYFELTYESADNLIETDYSELFSSEYSVWRDTVLEAYENMSSALSGVRTETIISHEEVASDVFCTGYSNGTLIYVNYNDEAVTVNGVKVEGMSYAVVEGK